MRAIIEEKETLRNQLEIQQTISRNKTMELTKIQGSCMLFTYVTQLIEIEMCNIICLI